jgi:hypothetical protein
MKYYLLTNNKIYLILVICLLLNSYNFKELEIAKEKMLSKSTISTESNRMDKSEYYSSPIIVKSISNRIEGPVGLALDTPILSPIVSTVRKVSPLVQGSFLFPNKIQSCGCANLVKCQPCGVVLIKPQMIDCPCAPKPKCRICPPLSIIHEMAAKKALQDQKMTYNLRGYTGRINQLLDSITKYSTDVVKYEMKAKEMAQKMEESSLKANFARRNMIKVKYHVNIVK